MFVEEFIQQHDLFFVLGISPQERQSQTNEVFSDKWTKYSKKENQNQDCIFEFVKRWISRIVWLFKWSWPQKILRKQSIVIDAGCGPDYKVK